MDFEKIFKVDQIDFLTSPKSLERPQFDQIWPRKLFLIVLVKNGYLEIYKKVQRRDPWGRQGVESLKGEGNPLCRTKKHQFVIITQKWPQGLDLLHM